MNPRKVLWAAMAFMVILQCSWAQEGVKPSEESAAPQPPVKISPPPSSLDYVISEMTAKGTAEEHVAKFDMNLKVEVLSDQKQQVQLLSGDISISKLSISGGFLGKGVYLVRSARGVDLLIERKGKYDIAISFVQKISEVDSQKAITLPLAPAVKSVVELVLPLPEVEVKTEPEISVETKKISDKECRVTVYGGTTELVTLKWIPKAPEREIPPIVFADQTTLIEVGRGVLRVDSAIDYAVLQGKIDALAVKLPADCSLLSLEGKEIRSWDIEEKDGEKILKIDLIGEVKDTHQIALKIEKVLPKIPVTLDVPRIEVMDVAREKGFIAVIAAKGIQIESSDAKDISQIDVRDLPTTLQQKAKEALLAFKYLKRPFEIKLAAEEVEAKVSAEVFTGVRASLDTLRLASTIEYDIRDAGVFHLMIQLAEGLKLIDVKGANINNWELDPKSRMLKIDLRSKAEGSYELHLETEAELKETQGIAIPAIQLVDVERERGYIAVSAVPGIRVESVAIKGISQIDVKELPPEACLKTAAPDLAFRYIKPGYEVTVNISEIQPEVEAELRTLVTIDEKEMDISTDVLYKIHKAGIFQLKLKIPKELRRQDVVGEDIDEQSWDEQTGVLTISLRNKVEGDYQLTLETEKTLEDVKGGIDIPVISAVDVKKERGFVAIKTKASIRVKPAEGKIKGLDDIDITELPWNVQEGVGSVVLAFKYFAQPWELSLSVEEVEPRVIAETFNFVSVGEKLVQVSATIKYNILHAGVEQFKVKMPEGAENVDINGEGIRHKDEDKENNTWTITLQSKRTGEYKIFFTFQQKIPKDADKVEYTGIEALDVERETGYLAIAARADVELEPNTEASKKLTPIDEREIPVEYKAGITIPILIAYRYLEHPYVAVLSAVVHDPAEVTVAIIETCKLETTVTRMGEMITDFVCNVRNSRQQYLELELPENATIDYAFVAGEPVTPLQERRPKAGVKPIEAAPAATAEKRAESAVEPPPSIPKYRDEDTVVVTKIPIARAGKSDQAFEVRLRYRSKRKELGIYGVLDLVCPKINIGIMRLGWEVALPERYRIIRDSGNMDMVQGSYAFESQLQTIRGDVSVSEMRRAPQAPSLAAKKVPADVKAQPQLQANWEAIRNLEQQSAVKGGAGRGPAQRSIYTGRRPDLPNRFYFQSLIVPPEEPGQIRATYIKGNVVLPFYGVLAAAVLVACYLCWNRLPLAAPGRFGTFLAAVVVVLGIRTLAEGAFAGFLNVIIASILIFEAGAAVQVLSRVRRGRRERRGKSLKTPATGEKATQDATPKTTEEDSPKKQ